jgi:pimeloyl-ACP methyl ester carboxylesterase
MAVRWPARVSRLCLVDTVAFDEWPGREVKVARAMLPLTRHLPPTWLLSILRTDLMRGYLTSERAAHSIDMYVRPFASTEGRDALVAHLTELEAQETMALAPRLEDLVQPTAIVWGAEDPFLPPTIARRLQGSIPGATLDVVPEMRHFMPEEAPERVASVIASLLER